MSRLCLAFWNGACIGCATLAYIAPGWVAFRDDETDTTYGHGLFYGFSKVSGPGGGITPGDLGEDLVEVGAKFWLVLALVGAAVFFLTLVQCWLGCAGAEANIRWTSILIMIGSVATLIIYILTDYYRDVRDFCGDTGLLFPDRPNSYTCDPDVLTLNFNGQPNPPTVPAEEVPDFTIFKFWWGYFFAVFLFLTATCSCCFANNVAEKY